MCRFETQNMTDISEEDGSSDFDLNIKLECQSDIVIGQNFS
jgi:hypothetical protein